MTDDHHDERSRRCAPVSAPSSRRECPNTSSGFSGPPIGWPSISATGCVCSCATRSSIRRFMRGVSARSIDPDRFELSDLARLPTMTKSEMMAAFDDVVTDRRLRLASSRSTTWRNQSSEPSLLLDEYVCLASGGSSGLRGSVRPAARRVRRLRRLDHAAGDGQAGSPPDRRAKAW